MAAPLGGAVQVTNLRSIDSNGRVARIGCFDEFFPGFVGSAGDLVLAGSAESGASVVNDLAVGEEADGDAGLVIGELVVNLRLDILENVAEPLYLGAFIHSLGDKLEDVLGAAEGCRTA